MTDIFNTEMVVQPAESTRQYRRIVTAVTPDKQEIIAEDRLCPHRIVYGGIDTMISTELWKEEQTPCINIGEYVDKGEGFSFCPPPSGHQARILELPPVYTYAPADAPLDFHRTPTVDYGIVLEGECYLTVGQNETLVHEGDIVIQRGTSHAWTNRSDRACRIFFVMCGAESIPGLDTL